MLRAARLNYTTKSWRNARDGEQGRVVDRLFGMRSVSAVALAVSAFALAGCAAQDVAEPSPLPGDVSKPMDPGPQEDSPIRLPVEVLGEDGLVREINFNMGISAYVQALRLRCSRCGYRDNVVDADRTKASVRFNDGPWIPINNATATFDARTTALGGLSGAHNTVDLEVPVGQWNREGSNTLAFRFEGTDGFTNGYRILDVEFVTATGVSTIGANVREDKPEAWEPPLDTERDIRLGAELWNGTRGPDLRESPLSDATLQAACADCHASGGEDLKYFNYSNFSIEARARFHGLSDLQAQRIASYIRSVDIEAPELARPWNPPFQPGPGTDSRPASAWSAGAGLDAVLDSDADMLPFLFPDGTRNGAMRDVIDWDKTLNLREMPVSVQFPDWKSWLPEVHPRDIWPDTWDAGKPERRYAEAVAAFEATPPAEMAEGEVSDYLTLISRDARNWIGDGRYGKKAGGSGSEWRALFSDNLDVRNPDYSVQEAKRAVGNWIAVRQWELVQRFDLAALAPQIHPEGGELYAWPTRGQNVHQLAPHITADNINDWDHQTPSLGDYRSTLWYQLQMTINPGQRQSMSVQPVDWPYQPRHILQSGNRTGVYEPLRYFQSFIKMYQQANNGFGPVKNGFQMRNVHPFRFYSGAQSNGNEETNDRRPFAHLDTYETNLRNRLTNAFLLEFLDIVEQWDPDTDWVREGRGDGEGLPCTRELNSSAKWGCMAPKDQVPIRKQRPRGEPHWFTNENDHADDFYQLIPLLREQGVPTGTVDRLRDWCAIMWPAGDWDTL